MNNLENPIKTIDNRQNILGSKGLVVFLALLSAFVPLSTDLYLPALPTMTQYFHVQAYEINLTLILFFVFYSLATLVWGPLSDKYGRRPVLLTGLALYTAASALCSFATDIYQLICFRVLQAIGGGAASAIATAIVKDVYAGKKREKVIALVQAMVVISPAVAPVLGALLLQFTTWRGVFAAQAVIGVLAVSGAVMFKETLTEKNNGTILKTLGRLGVVLKNPPFAALLLIFSMVSIATLAFISSSSYIFQDTFGLSSQVFSYYFAFNAAGMLLGPYIYIRLSARFKRFGIVSACFAVMALAGLMVLLLGRLAPWVFALTLLPATIAGSCVRPPGTFLMLDQQKNDAGSASSLMSSFATVMGSIGMVIISLFDNRYLVYVVGGLNILIGLICGVFWLVAAKKPLLSKVRDQ